MLTTEEILLKTPTGELADKMTRILNLYQWAKSEQNKGKNIILVGLGHPSSPVKLNLCSDSLEHCKELGKKINKIESNLKVLDETPQEREKIKSLVNQMEEFLTYDEKEISELAAKGLQKFYSLDPEEGASEVEIKGKNILFTPGGQGGLSAIFGWVNRTNSGEVLLQTPYYTLYNRPENKLLTYDVILDIPNNQTVKSFKDSLEEAKKYNKKINMALFCTPNNPSGKSITEDEWEFIIQTLKDEDCYIVVDEAYAELNFSDNPFLMEFIQNKLVLLNKQFSGEELKEKKDIYLNFLKKVIVLRSATKGFAAASARKALIYTFDEKIRDGLAKEIDDMGQPPFSAKVAYSKAINKFYSRVLDEEVSFLRLFYESQVRHVEKGFKEMGIAVKKLDGTYDEVEGTFYVIGDFKSLLGMEVKEPEIQTKLKEVGLNGKTLNTDQDIAYWLLFVKGCMLAPVSYFGGVPEEGKLRITCSGGKKLLDEVLNRINEVLEIPQKQITAGSLPISEHIRKNDSLKIESLNNKKTTKEKFISPLENFAKWMEIYWGEILAKSEEVSKIRNDHANLSLSRLKFLIQPYFVEFINKLLNLSSFEKMKKDTDLDKLFLGKTDDFLYVIQKICLYLKNKHGFESFSFDFNFSFDCGFDFDTEFEERIKMYLENYNRVEQINDELKYEENKINLISNLVFEKIFYDAIEDGIESPFSEIFHQFYNQGKERINDNLDFIEKIVEKKASLDYSHPRGNEESTKIMANALNLWYETHLISPSNVLFFSINIHILLNKAFKNRIVSINENFKFIGMDIKEKNESIAIVLPRVFNDSGKYIGDVKFLEIVNFVKKSFQDNPNHFFIINEIDVEKCVDATPMAKRSLFKILLDEGISKDRMMLIRTAEGTFSLSNEKISMLVTFNEKMMSNLVTVSSSLYVHTPSFLEYAYAKSMHDFVTSILDNNSQYREEYVQYKNRLDKLIHILKNPAERRKIDSVPKGKEIGRAVSVPQPFLKLQSKSMSFLEERKEEAKEMDYVSKGKEIERAAVSQLPFGLRSKSMAFLESPNKEKVDLQVSKRNRFETFSSNLSSSILSEEPISILSDKPKDLGSQSFKLEECFSSSCMLTQFNVYQQRKNEESGRLKTTSKQVFSAPRLMSNFSKR